MATSLLKPLFHSIIFDSLHSFCSCFIKNAPRFARRSNSNMRDHYESGNVKREVLEVIDKNEVIVEQVTSEKWPRRNRRYLNKMVWRRFSPDLFCLVSAPVNHMIVRVGKDKVQDASLQTCIFFETILDDFKLLEKGIKRSSDLITSKCRVTVYQHVDTFALGNGALYGHNKLLFPDLFLPLAACRAVFNQVRERNLGGLWKRAKTNSRLG